MSQEFKALYDDLGEETFNKLVAGFYRRVAVDPVLRRLYPEEDLSAAERRLRMFLIQYWGGPTTYSAERGHPRLRARHVPFSIGEQERDAWLRAMIGSMDELHIPEPAYSTMKEYFENTAQFMINTDPMAGFMR